MNKVKYCVYEITGEVTDIREIGLNQLFFFAKNYYEEYIAEFSSKDEALKKLSNYKFEIERRNGRYYVKQYVIYAINNEFDDMDETDYFTEPSISIVNKKENGDVELLVANEIIRCEYDSANTYNLIEALIKRAKNIMTEHRCKQLIKGDDGMDSEELNLCLDINGFIYEI